MIYSVIYTVICKWSSLIKLLFSSINSLQFGNLFKFCGRLAFNPPSPVRFWQPPPLLCGHPLSCLWMTLLFILSYFKTVVLWILHFTIILSFFTVTVTLSDSIKSDSIKSDPKNVFVKLINVKYSTSPLSWAGVYVW